MSLALPRLCSGIEKVNGWKTDRHRTEWVREKLTPSGYLEYTLRENSYCNVVGVGILKYYGTEKQKSIHLQRILKNETHSY